MTQQDDITQRVLTDDEIRGEIHNVIGFAFDPGELQTVNGDDLMRVARALLSKLRAPVADEQFKAAFPNGVLTAARFHELWESAGHNPNPDRTLLENLAWQVGKFAGLVAKEASAPVAGEAQPSDAEVLKVYAETVAEYADGRGFEAGTVAFARSLLRRYAAPQASAGEAQPVAWRYQTPTGWHATTDAQKAVSLRAHHPVEPLYPKPQASAEDVRDVNAAMAAEYQRWIDWFHKGRDYDSFLKECVFSKTQADKDGEKLAETSNNTGCSSLSSKSEKQDAGAVVLPPLPAELRDVETEARAYARSAVLANLQRCGSAPTVDSEEINIGAPNQQRTEHAPWRADDPDLMLALGRQFLLHPQTKPLVGREALVLRCIRAALDVREGKAC